MTNTLEWAVYTGIVVGAAVLGLMAGQVVQWRVGRGLHVPAWAHATGSRRAGAIMLSLLAILTVLSTMLTSWEVQRAAQARAAASAEQRACTRELVQRLTDRTQISEADHLNTTLFVDRIRDAYTGGAPDYPAIVGAADAYLAEQDRLERERRVTPINEHACR